VENAFAAAKLRTARDSPCRRSRRRRPIWTPPESSALPESRVWAERRRPPPARRALMHGERGQSADIVVRVSVDIVVAVAEDHAAAERGDSKTIPRDHRMRDPKRGVRLRFKSGTGVAGNDIAQHDGDDRVAGRRICRDVAGGVVGSLATMVTWSDARSSPCHPRRFRSHCCSL
jgi:hypothetical protein